MCRDDVLCVLREGFVNGILSEHVYIVTLIEEHVIR